MVFSPPVVGCLVKKGLQKGGSRAPQNPPGYALGKIKTQFIYAEIESILHGRAEHRGHLER